jgi:hypothetical protein
MPRPCHAHVVPMPCRSLIHTCHAAPLPCSDSAVSFVKVRMVSGNIRTASPAVKQSVFFVVCCYHSFPRHWQTLFGFTLTTCTWDRYASDNNLRGTPRGSRKKPNVGRSPTDRLSTVVLCHGHEKNGMVGAGHGRGMANVNQTWPHCVNQMGKTHSNPLAARHGRGTAWARHAMCESAFTMLLNSPLNNDNKWHEGNVLCSQCVYCTVYGYIFYCINANEQLNFFHFM